MIPQLVIILLALAGSTSGLEEKPQNTCGLAGTEVTLRCKGTQSEGILVWEKSTLAQPTRFNSVTQPHYDSSYSYSTRVSVLTIKGLRNSDAGTYVCRPSSDLTAGAYAQVCVLATAPSCTSDPLLTSLVSTEDVTTTCMVPFKAAFGYKPMMEWEYVNLGTTITPTTTSTSSELTSVYTETVPCDHTGRQYKVTTSFPPFDTSTLPDNTWDHATNAPTYAHLYTSDAMAVFCRLTAVTIMPDSNLMQGTGIVCAAEPVGSVTEPVTYSLTVTMNNLETQVSGQEYTIPSDFTGSFSHECFATQTFNGNTYMESNKIEQEISAAGRPHQLMSVAVAIFGLHALLATIMPM